MQNKEMVNDLEVKNRELEVRNRQLEEHIKEKDRRILDLESKMQIYESFLNYMEASLPQSTNHKIYFDCGDKTLDAYYPPIQNKVDALMRKKGYSEKNWMTQYFPGQEHSEDAWRGRVQTPLTFMLGK
jgi:hypothetical protein